MPDTKHPAEVLADYVAEHGSGNTADVSAMLRTIPALEAKLDELRAANEAFGKRQEWWNEKMFALEAENEALRARLDAVRGV